MSQNLPFDLIRLVWGGHSCKALGHDDDGLPVTFELLPHDQCVDPPDILVILHPNVFFGRSKIALVDTHVKFEITPHEEAVDTLRCEGNDYLLYVGGVCSHAGLWHLYIRGHLHVCHDGVISTPF